MSTIQSMTDRHQAPSYPLRMPPETKELMIAAAKQSGRSLHAEIIARLQQSLEARADATQLEIANEALRAQLDGCTRVAQVLDITQKLLAETLVKAIDRMPQKMQDEYSAIRTFACGVAEGDARSIGAGFLAIYQDDPKTVGEIHKFMAEIEPVIAAKLHGEKKAAAKTLAIKKKP